MIDFSKDLEALKTGFLGYDKEAVLAYIRSLLEQMETDQKTEKDKTAEEVRQLTQDNSSLREQLATQKELYDRLSDQMERLLASMEKSGEYSKQRDEELDAFHRKEASLNELLEQAEEKAEATIREANRKAGEIRAQAEQEQQELLAKSNREREQLMAQAKAAIQEMVSQAEQQKKQILLEARVSSQEMLSKADLQSQDMIRKAQARCDRSQEHLTAIRKELAQLQETLRPIFAELEEEPESHEISVL